MNNIKHLVKKSFVNGLWYTLGRRNLVRLSRFLANEARLDVANDMEANGELLVQQVILDRLLGSDRNVVFDVGGNVGLWTKSLLRQAPATARLQIHLFEPCAETYQELAANLQKWNLLDRAVPCQLALSSHGGEADFYSLGPTEGRNSLHPIGEPERLAVGKVTLKTIDQYCLETHIDHVNFIKVDTEGHDFEVIAGAGSMLKNLQIDAMQFEYNWRWIGSRHYLKDVFDFIQPLAYSLGKVTPFGVEFYSHWHFELETFREANFLLVRTPLTSLFPKIQWWDETA